jgi:hypothetical protein
MDSNHQRSYHGYGEGGKTKPGERMQIKLASIFVDDQQHADKLVQE